MKTINTTEKPQSEWSPETLAAAVTKISESMTVLLKSGLNRKAIVVLLYDYTKVPKRDIDLVLNGLERLKGYYTQQK